MKRMRKLISLGIIVIIGIGVCACNIKENTDNAKNSELVLNERQKEILEEAGLSTNPEELTYSQKKSIVAIEEMLTAVEKKYNRSFSYDGYVQKGPLEYEHLIAYPSDGDPQTDSFEVRKVEGENGTEYEDDYTEYVEELIVSSLDNEHIKVFADIYTTELSAIPTDKKEYNEKVSSWKGVFIYCSNSDEMSRDTEIIQQLLENENLRYDCDIIFLKEDVIDKLTEYNYTEYLTSDCYVKKEKIRID